MRMFAPGCVEWDHDTSALSNWQLTNSCPVLFPHKLHQPVAIINDHFHAFQSAETDLPGNLHPKVLADGIEVHRADALAGAVHFGKVQRGIVRDESAIHSSAGAGDG